MKTRSWWNRQISPSANPPSEEAGVPLPEPRKPSDQDVSPSGHVAKIRGDYGFQRDAPSIGESKNSSSERVHPEDQLQAQSLVLDSGT